MTVLSFESICTQQISCKSIVAEGPLQGKKKEVIANPQGEKIEAILEGLPKAQCPQGAVKILKKAHLLDPSKTPIARLVTKSDIDATPLVERSNSALQRLEKHPGFVQQLAFYKTQKDRGIKYVLYHEYCNTGELTNLIAKGVLSPKQKDYIAYKLLEALDAMHAKGVAHRDLKTQNIVVNRILLDGEGKQVEKIEDARVVIFEPKITDFDVSYTAPVKRTRNAKIDLHAVCGSAGYFAPEKAFAVLNNSRKIQGQPFFNAMTEKEIMRHDVWAMGLILYQLYHAEVPNPMKAAWHFRNDPDNCLPRLTTTMNNSRLFLAKDKVEAVISDMLCSLAEQRPTARQALMRFKNAHVIESRK